MTTTIEAMKQAQYLLRWTHFGECRTYPGPVPEAREVDKLLREAIAAEEAQGVELVAITLETAPVGTKAPAIMGGAWCKMDRGWKWNGPDGTGGTFPRPGGDWTGEFIAPPANTEFLAVKLELMTAERDKMQLELGDLRALRARRPAHDNPIQIGGPDDWAIAGIEVKIGDGGPNFHLYRLLGSNELEPGVYELFTRPAKPPAGERAALVGRLRGLVDAARLRGPGFAPCLTCDDVSGIADMLTADAQKSEPTEQKLPEFFASYEYAPDFSVLVSVYRRHSDDVPELVHQEPLIAQASEPTQQVAVPQEGVSLLPGKSSDISIEGLVILDKDMREWAQGHGLHLFYLGSWHVMQGKKWLTVGYESPLKALEACWEGSSLDDAPAAAPPPTQADALATDHVENPLNMGPMTPEQISDTYQKATGQHLRPCDKHAVETLTREIEAHHEIGVKP